MRVIAGKAKGHKLKTLQGLQTRPTTDRIKETLFNIISFDLVQCDFLDLFAGRGAIGIEALSRGAKQCVFVEKQKEACHMIQQNLKHTKLEQNAVLLQKDVSEAISFLQREKKAFDIIFLDPPYQGDLAETVLQEIAKARLLKKNGYIIWERSAKRDALSIEGFTVIKEKMYKTTAMTFLALEESTLC